MTIKKSVLIAEQCLQTPGVHPGLRDAEVIEVATVADGLQAMARIAREPPDLVILDVDMPGADGLSIVAQMARDEHTASIPVIILTEQSAPDVVRSCEAAGAHHVPMDLQAWEQHLDRQLQRPASRGQLQFLVRHRLVDTREKHSLDSPFPQ